MQAMIIRVGPAEVSCRTILEGAIMSITAHKRIDAKIDCIYIYTHNYL